MLKESRSEARNTCCSLMAPLRAAPLLHFRKPLVCTRLISEDAVTPWRPNRCIWLGRKCETAAWRNADRENVEYISSKSNHALLVLQTELSSSRCKETEKRLMVFVPTKWGKNGRTLSQTKRFEIFVFSQNTASLCSGKDFYSVFYPQDKVFVPRSSSPVTVYVEFPCIIEQGKLNLTQWVNFRISAFKSLWAHKCIQGSHCFLLSQLSQQLHGMIWKRVCPLWDRRETPSAVRWEKNTEDQCSFKKWTSVFVTSPRKWHILNVAM